MPRSQLIGMPTVSTLDAAGIMIKLHFSML
jgi:hypothetical protein